MRTAQTFFRSLAYLLSFAGLGAGSHSAAALASPAESVLQAEQERVAVIAKSCEAAICIFEASGQGGGSGVIVSPDGFALTNFHVVAPCGAAMKCGMNNGELYDAVVVGVDPVGDVALIQLLGRDDFPAASLGDSDLVEVGDWAFAVGNPFLLADDYHPSVSYGMISGTHRYQYPAGTLLEYADCLQTDAAINPGNSGGPLFNADGELIGVNGRGSFEKRGRVNVGVGYAISINQIKRFLTHLKSGRIVDHASLGFTVTSSEDGRVVVDDILESSDAYRRGLRYGDQVLRFADRRIHTANELKTALGTYPRDWIVPLTYSREGEIFRTQVRLPGVHDPAELIDLIQKQESEPVLPPDGHSPDEEKQKDENPLDPLKKLMPEREQLPLAVSQRYEEVRGYANYWYNRQAQERIWKRYLEQSNPPRNSPRWNLDGTTADGGKFSLQLAADVAEIRIPQGQSGALFTSDLTDQTSPPGSGGLLVALHLWQRVLEKGLQRFGEVYYLGQLPTGTDEDFADVLVGIYGGVEVRFLFSPTSSELVGIDYYSGDYSDPCVIRFSEQKEFAGRLLPSRWRVYSGTDEFVNLHVESWETTNEVPAEETN